MLSLLLDGAGEDLFNVFIRPSLTTADLMRCSQTNRKLRSLCRTYTLPEVWMNKGYYLDSEEGLEARAREWFSEGGLEESSEESSEGGSEEEVTPFEGSRRSPRPRRLVLFIEQTDATWWWTFVYHPDHELDILHAIVATHIQESACEVIEDDEPTIGQQRRLLSASFGDHVLSRVVDVTHVVRDKIRDGRLQLFPPRPCNNSFCSESAPAFPRLEDKRWWYVDIFGDPWSRKSKFLVPWPPQTKYLVLKVQGIDDGEQDTIYFSENSAVDIPLMNTIY